MPPMVCTSNSPEARAQFYARLYTSVADVCVLSTEGHWPVSPSALRSQGKSTPFSGSELPGRVLATVVSGHLAFEA
jgi:dihydroorotase-like cyclic amidohydrolase